MINRILVILVVVLALVGCASQVAPRGGDKDVTPPAILVSEPQNGSLNFSGNEIYFEFDEYVRVAGAQQELIVTPPLKYPVEFKMRGKKVNVVWTDTLIEDATYMFQFGEGIVDVNESNPLDSNIFVFSTGDYIDSFYMEGKVIDAFTLEPMEDTWVMLYTDTIDSLPYKELPRYFARTDENGMYKLQYLATGNYKVFALQATNSSYLYDQPDEAIAYFDGTFDAQSPADTNAEALPDLRLFLEEDTLQYIAEYSQLDKRGLLFLFNRPVETYSLEALTGEAVSTWDTIWNENRDSLVYWFSQPLEYDSLHLRIQADDFTDTLYLRKPKALKKGKSKGKDDAVGLAIKASTTSKLLHFKPFILASETPLVGMDLEGALLVEDSDSMDLAAHARLEESRVVIDYPWKEGERYRVFIPDSALSDRFGMTNDTLKYTLIASETEDFGTFQLNYTLPDPSHKYLLQLLKSDGSIVQEDLVPAVGTMEYIFLATGNYKLKVLFDENGNGEWDTGHYLRGEQPEKVAFYDQTIELRSNWVTEIDWELNLDGEVMPEEGSTSGEE